ncbi:carbon storage regulator [Arthrobacter livingstonensis]|uniref:Translational regulator CsrA n=1 Tax=Arthrobacter livingstonensis TaxID=670078 RepID=A0A2V5LAT2_9MICC|nr:carbon storage regulator CsrA [Arthrobacter livingstonensis]PYI66873.1 carbon storage regulator [Arthrobacter livingstonensis]
MLVLTRKIGETIIIGGNITVTILDGGRGEGVRIGIDAPRDVSIHRSEVVEAVSASNREAVAGSAGTAASTAESPEQLILAALGLGPADPAPVDPAQTGPAPVDPAATD